jgi:HPt (histidine-containing phosphotransfer) domain-containing protein
MRSIDAAVEQDRFEELRGIFHARLRNDQVRLTTLSAVLAREESDARRTFDDIRQFAHRLCGAAAIFESPEIVAAAEALEKAARAAHAGQSNHSDAEVWAALERLTQQLTLSTTDS